MKEIANQSKSKLPDYSPVKSVWDVVDFADRQPGSLVIKPRDGAGSIGVTILPTPKDLEKRIKEQGSLLGMHDNLMVETYVDAPMITVDGVFSNKKIDICIVNRYYMTCYEAANDNSFLPVAQVPPGSNLFQNAVVFASELFSVFPETETNSFHLELFDTPDGLVLCEVAARTGGARFNDLAIQYLGVDLEKEACLGQLNLKNKRFPIIQKKSDILFGFITLSRIGGVLAQAPSTCPFSNVVDYRLHYEVGTEITSNKKCTNCVADMLFYAHDEKGLDCTIKNIIDWHNSNFKWESNETVLQKG